MNRKIIDFVRRYGVSVDKTSDKYTAKPKDARTDRELNYLLVINEYFGNNDACKTHEINAYIS